MDSMNSCLLVANHYVSQTWMFDGQASYDFTFVPPVENQPVAGYSKDAKDMSSGKDGKPTESSMAQSPATACRSGSVR